MVSIDGISAVTLATADMARALAFYRDLGFVVVKGSDNAPFYSLKVGPNYLNLVHQTRNQIQSGWGRIIFYVSDVDEMYERVVRCGFQPQFAPQNGPWGERYFHVKDPDGHNLSFAKPL